MKILNLAVVIISLVLVCACGGGTANSGDPTSNVPPSDSSPRSIQEILDSAVEQGVDGILVYVVNGNGSEQSFMSGVEDRSSQQSIRNDSLFKIASISKLYIATATAKIAAQGGVRLTDTLAFWLPEYTDRIANADSITLKNLLEHRSGIPDFDSQVGFSWNDAHTDIDQTLEFALDLPADFAPNARYEYSNTNYLLIGKILDAALGFSHHDYIKTNISEMLGLVDTYSLLAQIDATRLIHGYWNGTDRVSQDYVIPGGSMVATAKDTALFLHALNTGELLSADESSQYVYFFNHTGWLPGYQSIARYHSDIDSTVVQFVSKTGSDSETIAGQTYDQIIALLRN